MGNCTTATTTHVGRLTSLQDKTRTGPTTGSSGRTSTTTVSSMLSLRASGFPASSREAIQSPSFSGSRTQEEMLHLLDTSGLGRAPSCSLADLMSTLRKLYRRRATPTVLNTA